MTNEGKKKRSRGEKKKQKGGVEKVQSSKQEETRLN